MDVAIGYTLPARPRLDDGQRILPESQGSCEGRDRVGACVAKGASSPWLPLLDPILAHTEGGVGLFMSTLITGSGTFAQGRSRAHRKARSPNNKRPKYLRLQRDVSSNETVFCPDLTQFALSGEGQD